MDLDDFDLMRSVLTTGGEPITPGTLKLVTKTGRQLKDDGEGRLVDDEGRLQGWIDYRGGRVTRGAQNAFGTLWDKRAEVLIINTEPLRIK